MPGQGRGGPSKRGRPSPTPPEQGAETRFLAIGLLQAPRGVRGEFRVFILTDFPERFKRLRSAFLGEEHAPVDVESVRMTADGAILKLRGVDTPEAARPFANQLLYIPVEEAKELEDDQYYWYQILGLEVWTTDERRLGEVVDILPTGSNDVYVVKGDAGEVLIPAIEDVVTAIDLECKRMTVELIEGLL
jgi:16S rRNA processing protein RimM